MARETDFLDLYRSLGLKPGCGLDEFKQAYRRRVSVLHPDRRMAGPHAAVAAERLQRLTALYGEAMEFQRRHGRLPGAAAPARSPARGATAGGPAPATPAGAPQAPPRSRSLILLAVLVMALLFWFGQTPPQDASDTPSADTADTLSPAAADYPDTTPAEDTGEPRPGYGGTLERGMHAGAVRRIEGEPMMDNGEFWEYGPSWIRFEHGRVVDWYSSPLRPLKLAATRRPVDTVD